MNSTSNAGRARAFLDTLLIVVFVCAITLPTFDLFVRDDEARGPGPEFRRAAPRPVLEPSLVSIYKFPSAYEAYFNDTFGMRDRLLRLNSLEKYYALGISPTSEQVVGKDGWLFYAGGRSMEVFRGALPFKEKNLADWQSELEGRARALASIGCKYAFVVVPNKESIYPERIPTSLNRVGPTRLDQFMEWMRAHSTVDVLDMRAAFLKDKAQDTGPLDPLYTPYGTHWTSRGVYTAYRAIVEHLSRNYPGIAPLELSDFEIIHLPTGADSLAGNLYLQGILVQPGDMLARRNGGTFTPVTGHWPPRFQRTRGSGPNLLPHTLVFHDSFGPFIACTLAESFETLDMSEGLFNSQRISPGNTKIVIEMFVERYLVNHAPTPAPDEVLVGEDPRFAGLPHELLTLDPRLDATFPGTGVKTEFTDSGALRFARTGPEWGLTVGPIRFPERGQVLLRLDVSSDRLSSLAVMWRSKTGPEFKRRDSLVIQVSPERNVSTLEIPLVGTEVELLLRTPEMDVPITLHALSVRSSDAP